MSIIQKNILMEKRKATAFIWCLSLPEVCRLLANNTPRYESNEWFLKRYVQTPHTLVEGGSLTHKVISFQ
ncbi:hypothetical protein COD11_04865 [Bacillus sp. AFS040349]|nr:hypothetical protein COD11_04865 [Bacillus sp. AFS040349]